MLEGLRLALRRTMVSYGNMPTRCGGDGRDTMKSVEVADVVGSAREYKVEVGAMMRDRVRDCSSNVKLGVGGQREVVFNAELRE